MADFADKMFAVVDSEDDNQEETEKYYEDIFLEKEVKTSIAVRLAVVCMSSLLSGERMRGHAQLSTNKKSYIATVAYSL